MAVGDVTACRIASATNHNGFVAEIDIEGLAVGGTYAFGMGTNNDPAAAKVVFTVTSPGFDATGGATTIQRTIYGTQWVRLAYPNQLTADETDAAGTLTVRISLSDFIYVADSAITLTAAAGFYTKTAVPNNAVSALAVTNNSTLAYPKVIGRWATVPYQRVTGDFVIEAVCVHGQARDGKPVACVVFEATDGTNTVTHTVTAMTVSDQVTGAGLAAGNKVLVYAATIPVATLTTSLPIACNFKAYPWVGQAAATLDSRTTADGFAQPDERLGPLSMLNDKAGTYGQKFAVVDFTNGNDSSATTWTYDSQAAAETAYATVTNSYKYIWRALAALDAAAPGGRTDPGACVVLISGVGTINWPGATPGSVNLGAQATWATITRLSSVSRAVAIVTADGVNDPETQKVKFEDVTLFSAAGAVGIRGDDALVDIVWVDNCTINLTTSGTAPIINWHTCYATRNTVTALTGGFGPGGALKAPWALVRGNAGATSAGPTGVTHVTATQYCVLGNYNIAVKVQATGNAAGHQISDNTIVAFNTAYTVNNTSVPWQDNAGTATGLTHGNAFVQNVVEGQVNGTWLMEPDDEGVATNHLIFWHNTLAGERVGMGFNWLVNAHHLKSNYSQRGNIFCAYATKSDVVLTENAVRTGQWPVHYHVSAYGNHRLDFEGVNEGEGKFSGLYTVDGGTWAMVHDASNDNGPNNGDDTGNGDYHLTATSSAYSLMPAGLAVLPFDLEGTARNNSGGGSAGAYEMNAPAGGGGEGLWTPVHQHHVIFG